MNKLAWPPVIGALLCATTSIDCGAVQRKEIKDGNTVEALISEREITRIRVDGAMITGVVGKIHATGGCGPDVEGVPVAPLAQAQQQVQPAELSITCDRSKGEVYVKPAGQENKPINLFVSTEHATYTLVLHKANLPSDTIVLVDRSVAAADARSTPALRQISHVKRVKSMLRAMVGNRAPDDVQTEEVNIPLQLWQEASFTLIRRFRGRGLLGERYLLTNISAAPLTVAEQEFDREGADVVAVAVEEMNLMPGASTWVHVIRREAAL